MAIEKEEGVRSILQLRSRVRELMSERRWVNWTSTDMDDRYKELDPDVVQSVIMRYIPGAIREHLMSGHKSFITAEFRPCVILFVNLPEIDYSSSDDVILTTLHQAMLTMQVTFRSCLLSK